MRTCGNPGSGGIATTDTIWLLLLLALGGGALEHGRSRDPATSQFPLPGFTEVARLDFTASALPTGWLLTGSGCSGCVASRGDPTAPASPPGILWARDPGCDLRSGPADTCLAAGNLNGSLSGPLGGGYRGVTMDLWLRLSAPLGARQVVFSFRDAVHPEDAADVRLVEANDGSGLGVRVDARPGSAPFPSRLALPASSPGARLTPGVWHHLTLVLIAGSEGAAAHRLAWWLDGHQLGIIPDLSLWAEAGGTFDHVAVEFHGLGGWRGLATVPALEFALDRLVVYAGGQQTLDLVPASVTLQPAEAVAFETQGLGTWAGLVTFTATGGTITSSGTYTAGSTPGIYRVIATVANGLLADTATVTVTSSGEGADQVVLQANDITGVAPYPAGGPETAVLLDGTRAAGTCFMDQLRNPTTAPGLAYGNLIGASTTCGRDEIAVFSLDDPPVVDTSDAGPGGIWTSAAGEQRIEDLAGGRVTVPVKLWLANRDNANASCPPFTGAPSAADGASDLYNSNRAGVWFKAEAPADFCNDPAALASLGYGPHLSAFPNFWDVVCPPAHTRPSRFTPGMINVYFVYSIFGGLKGLYCPRADSNVVLISTQLADEATLAHELGHAYALQHTRGSVDGPPYDWYPGELKNDNIMWTEDATSRTTFSLGQVFRMIADSASMLHRNGNLRGVRRCPGNWVTVATAPTWADSVTAIKNYITASDQDGSCPPVGRGWY